MREVTLPIEARTVALDFESFFRAEYPSLCQALVLLVGDPLEAEEIAQDTMTRVLERWDRVGVMDSPTGYAYRTALNLQRKMDKIIEDPVEGPQGLYWCTYLLKLAGGDLTIAGRDARGPGVSTFAVLGGTGAYADASGEATLTDTFESTEFVIALS